MVCGKCATKQLHTTFNEKKKKELFLERRNEVQAVRGPVKYIYWVVYQQSFMTAKPLRFLPYGP